MPMLKWPAAQQDTLPPFYLILAHVRGQKDTMRMQAQSSHIVLIQVGHSICCRVRQSWQRDMLCMFLKTSLDILPKIFSSPGQLCVFISNKDGGLESVSKYMHVDRIGSILTHACFCREQGYF